MAPNTGPAGVALNNFMNKTGHSDMSGTGGNSVHTCQQKRQSGVPSNGPKTPVHNNHGHGLMMFKLNSMVSVTNTSQNDSISVDTEGFDYTYGNKKNKRPKGN